MKHFLRVITMLLLLLFAVSCGRRAEETTEETLSPEEEAAGRYFLVWSVKDGRMEEAEGRYLRLRDNGKAELVSGDEKTEGRWRLKSETKLILNFGEKTEGKIRDGVIKITLDGAEQVYVKGRRAMEKYKETHRPPETLPPETEPPTTEEPTTEEPTTEEPTTEEPTTEEPTTEEPTTEVPTTEEPTTEEPTTEESTEETSAAEESSPEETLPESTQAETLSPAVLEKWNGTWYGYITIREASGAYRLLAGKTYEVYVTVKLEESGAGRYVVYNPFGFPLNTTEILTQGACTADEESLTILEVAPFGVPLANFDYWRLDAVEEGRPYSYTEPVKVGSDTIKGVIKLMRWGESWPAEDRAAFPDYVSYEAAVAAGTPPPYVP